MPRRAFRFGLVARTLAPGQTWADKARRAEELGYAVLTMPDHFRNQLAPVPALTAAALATTRLRVGSLVFAVDFHHPAVLAREAAAIDQLSGGRFELGLGAGWLRAEYEEAGIHYDAAGTRIERLAEAVTIIKGLLGGERLTFAGRHYTITDMEGRAGAQRPRPPIVIGGGGRRTLTVAAREADIIGLVPRARTDGGGLEWDDFGAPALLEKLVWVREAAGARFAALELNTLIQAAVVTDDAAPAAAQLARRFRTTRELVRECPYALVGTVSAIAETIQERRARYGISYLSIFEQDAEAFAPVVAKLAGT